MKIDFQLGKPDIYNPQDKTYLVPFSIVGGTQISQPELIQASQKPGGIEQLSKQKILTELCALLQIELYGRVLSDEQAENKSAEDKRLLPGVQEDTGGGKSKT